MTWTQKEYYQGKQVQGAVTLSVSHRRVHWRAVDRTIISIYAHDGANKNTPRSRTLYSDFQLDLFQQRSTKIKVYIM
jgi:hypothetical protein